MRAVLVFAAFLSFTGSSVLRCGAVGFRRIHFLGDAE
jgi:hypothetical protein